MRQFRGTKDDWVLDPHMQGVVISSIKRGVIAECQEVSEHSNHIAYVSDGTSWDVNPDEIIHNANLIAAAPELLRVVQSMQLSMMAHPDYQSGRNQEFVDYVDIAEDVIKKALGE